MRPSFGYRKKESQDTESTSFYSEKTKNKVISAQKCPSRKLSEFLYQNCEAQIRPKSTSLFQPPAGKSQEWLRSKNEQDPFLNAKLKFMADEANKHVVHKKVGRLYDELNMESAEENCMTTLKKEQEKENKSHDSSIRRVLAQRAKK